MPCFANMSAHKFQLTGVKPSPVRVNHHFARLARAAAAGRASGPSELGVSLSLLRADLLSLHSSNQRGQESESKHLELEARLVEVEVMVFVVRW